jgi:hypothetical protein
MDAAELSVIERYPMTEAEALETLTTFLTREVVTQTCPKETQFHLHTLAASLAGETRTAMDDADN